jgi:hypothetical protein
MKRLLTFGSPAKDFTLGWLLALLLTLLIVPMMAHAQVGYIDATSGFLKEYNFHSTGITETASGASPVIDVGAYHGGEFTIQATALTGTNPTLDVMVQACQDATTTYCVPLQMAEQFTAAGTHQLHVKGFARWLRVLWTIGGTGTPSATFSIYGAFKPYGGEIRVGLGDPCQQPGIPKQSLPIAVSAAGTTALVPTVGTKVTTVCAITTIFASGTSPTVQFKAGTQTTTACDTNPVTLTGAMSLPVTAGQGLVLGAGGTLFAAPSGNQLCVVAGGTTPAFNGVLTYVQQ